MGSIGFRYSDGTMQNHEYWTAVNFQSATVTGTINAIAYCLTPYMQGMKFYVDGGNDITAGSFSGCSEMKRPLSGPLIGFDS